MGLAIKVSFSYDSELSAPKRRKIFFRERNRAIKELEEHFRRNDVYLSKLEHYCGREARLYDSKKYSDSEIGEIWPGLIGKIGHVHMDAHGAVSPYALLYYGTHSDKWHRHSIITDHIRSMRIKSGIVEIDTKWWDGPNPD